MDKLGSGVFGDVFASSDDTVIKKIKLGSGIGSGLDKARHERDVLAVLQDRNLPIPRLLDYHEFAPNEHPQGYCAELTLSRLPGAPGNWTMTLTRDMALNMMTAMRDVQSALLDVTDRLPLLHGNLIDGILKEELPFTETDLRLFETLRPLVRVDANDCVPMHGDFNITNILFAPDSVSIIDFAEAMPGYAEDDLVGVCDEMPQEAVALLMEAFETVFERSIDSRAYKGAWLRRNVISYIFDRYKENDAPSAAKREADMRAIFDGAPS